MNLDQPPEAGDVPHPPLGPPIDFNICVCQRCGNSHHPGCRSEAFEPSTAPDVELAIARQLQAAAALVGGPAVEKFFRGVVEKISAHRWPVDAGGFIRKQCGDDAAEIIEKLLTQQ